MSSLLSSRTSFLAATTGPSAGSWAASSATRCTWPKTRRCAASASPTSSSQEKDSLGTDTGYGGCAPLGPVVAPLVPRCAIGVGMAIADHPLHRSRRTALPYRAPALRHDGNHCCLPYPPQRRLRSCAALCPQRAGLWRVPLGRPPALQPLRHLPPGFVRDLLRYYAAV